MSPLDDLRGAFEFYRKHKKQYPWAFIMHPEVLARMRVEQESRDLIYIDRLGHIRALSCTPIVDSKTDTDSIVVWHPEGGRVRYKRKFK